MRNRDLDRAAFRERYPNATVVRAISKKSRRRTYVVKDSGRLLLICVTDAQSTANLIEAVAVRALSRLDVPVASITETFGDSESRYLVQNYLDATSLDERLKAADNEESFRLGTIMGALLRRLRSLPASKFEGLPSPAGSWWDWIRSLRTGLPFRDDLTGSNVEITFVHNDFVPHNVLLKKESAHEVLALIDFEWSFLGDPTWDVGYLSWWLETEGYPHPEECWAGVRAAYKYPVDEARAEFYASIRSPEQMAWWQEGVPPPVGGLTELGDESHTNAP